MPDFSIRPTSVTGNFELVQADSTLLYIVKYKSLFSGEATSNFDGNSYAVRSANFWQSKFEVFRNDLFIGKFSFNWKGEIIITYSNTTGIENEMLFEYKGVWKFRFILSDRSGNELLAMASSGSILKYHYDVSVADGFFRENESKEILMICGYCANLYINTMMADG